MTPIKDNKMKPMDYRQKKKIYIDSFTSKISSICTNKCYPSILFSDSLWDSWFKMDDTVTEDYLIKKSISIRGNLHCLQPLKEPKKPYQPYLSKVSTSYLKSFERNLLERYHFPNWRFWVNTLLSIIGGVWFGGFFGAIPLVGISMLDIPVLTYIAGIVIFIVAFIVVFDKLCDPLSRTYYKQIPYTKEELETMRAEEERRYNIAVEQYPIKLKQYEEELNTYNNSIKERNTVINRSIPYIIQTVLSSLFVRSDDYSVVDEGPQQGRSENILFAKLMQVIPNSIHIDTRIAGYYPDLMVSTSNGIYIDIEIDEPYEIETKKEIHYLGSDDEDRNKRITNRGWVVLRFSEKQIITNCDTCVEIIKDLKKFIEQCDVSILDDIGNNCKLLQEKRWTKEEARLMALRNYRRTY